jgi:Fic/DOC family
VVFLAIHPFQDGNGRLSRILTTLLLLQQGYAYVPYSSLEHVVEQNKESYQDLRSAPPIPEGLGGGEAERELRNLPRVEFGAQRGTAAGRVTKRASL